MELKLAKNLSDGFFADIDKRLNQIPIEARDSAVYYHCRGLFYKLQGDNEKGRKYFMTALNADSNFISARRELSQLGASDRKEHTSRTL